MIKSTAIFLICFLGMYSCLDLSANSAAENGVILPSIESKNELIQMMVEVKTEHNTNTIQGFVGQLREMLDKLVNAQSKHKKIHAKMMKQCLNENKFRRKEIADGKVARARGTKALAKCRVSLKQALKELPGLQRTHRSYKRELARAQKARDLERKKYLKRKEEFAEAIKFLRSFIKYVGKKLKSYEALSLVELTHNLLKHSNKVNMLSEAAPILATIAMETSSLSEKDRYKFKPNKSLANKLRRLLKDLLAKLVRDNATNEKNERQAAAAFAVYKRRLVKVISTLARNIKRVQNQIKKMKRCINVESGVIASANKKIKRNSDLLGNADKMCKDFNKQFIEATRNRLNEIQTMRTILKIVAKRFAKLPKDLIAYLTEVRDGWRAYINSTEFKKFIEYERKLYKDNLKGRKLAASTPSANPVRAVVKGAKGIY